MKCNAGNTRIKPTEAEKAANRTTCRCGRLIGIAMTKQGDEATILPHNEPKQPEAPMPGHITVAEAAEIAGVSMTVIKRWIAREWVKAVRRGARAYAVNEASLRMCMAATPEGRGPDKGERKRGKRKVSSVVPLAG